MTTPMVADLDGDGMPEIIACKNSVNSPWRSAGLLVFDGRTGTLKKTINTAEYVTQGQCITIADILLDREGYMHCYNYSGSTGTQRWLNTSTIVGNNFLLTVADIMGDGNPELVCGKYIFNADNGTLLLNGTMSANGKGFASPNHYNVDSYSLPYYLYALADIDLDGTLELCAGNSVYKINITNTSNTTGNSWTLLRQAQSDAAITNFDGQTFIADFDGDGDMDSEDL